MRETKETANEEMEDFFKNTNIVSSLFFSRLYRAADLFYVILRTFYHIKSIHISPKQIW